MTRFFLSFLNAPALILLVAIGIAIQSSLFASYPLLYLQPDVVLVTVIWCALRRGFTEGGILTLIFAEMAEIHSASPQGLFLISFMLVYLGVRGISKLFVIPHLSSLIILTMCASIFWKLSCLGVLHLMNLAGNQWRHTLVLLMPGAVMEGVCAIWLYRGLDKFDLLTLKNERSRTALADEIQLEGEGL